MLMEFSKVIWEAAPVFKLIVSVTASTTFIFSQILVFGHLLHSITIIALFWFWVKPFKHLFSSSFSDQIFKNRL